MDSRKIAVVTGATGGIGREVVRKLDEAGFNCILIGKHEDELKNLFETLQNIKGKYYACDFSNVNNVMNVSKKIAKTYQTVDVLLNIAGVGIYKPIKEITLSDWERSFAIGNTAPFFLTQALLQNLEKSPYSVVINFGSGMGLMPAAGRSAYCSMKFALRGQTLSLAEEFRKSKPHFVLMSLGSVLTPFGPMSLKEKKENMELGKNYLTPEWIAKMTVKIINDKKREEEYTLYPSDYAQEWQK